jgi:hypothetical protein
MPAALLWRQGQCALNAPTALHTRISRAVAYEAWLFIVFVSKRFTIDHKRGSCIATLFSLCAPFKVAGFIVAVVVSAIKAMFGRRFGSKVLKNVITKSYIGVNPIRMHRNTSSTVVSKGVIAFVEASSLNAGPRAVHGRHGYCFAMRCVSFTGSPFCFNTQAAAGFRISCDQTTAFNTADATAIALAEPVRSSAAFTRKTNNNQPVKSLTGSVDEFRVFWAGLKNEFISKINLFSHLIFSENVNWLDALRGLLPANVSPSVKFSPQFSKRGESGTKSVSRMPS